MSKSRNFSLIKIKCLIGSAQHCCILDPGLRDQSLSPGPGSLCCVLGQEAVLSQSLSHSSAKRRTTKLIAVENPTMEYM